jgi:hypothetical protein
VVARLASPVPVLWFAFSDTKGWQVFLAAWAAYALGATSILTTYGGILPLPALVLFLGGPSFFFALAVLGIRANAAGGPSPPARKMATGSRRPRAGDAT